MPMARKQTSNKSVEEYRRLAEQCRERARMVSGGNERNRLLETAEIWEVMADRVGNEGKETKGHTDDGARPDMTEIKLDRLIEDMRLLKSQMSALDRRLQLIEAYLKPSEPTKQLPECKSRPWFAGAVARAAARAVFVLLAVGAATGALLHYLGA
jgi:hypothetical protein